MYQHILVPLDGSELSEAVLPHAQALAQRLGARLLLLRAANFPTALAAQTQPDMSLPPPELLDEAVQGEVEEARDYLTQVSQWLKDANTKVAWEVVEGDPSRAIVDTARKEGCDVIAMATHGRSGVPRLLLGSVADRVVRESHLPVLLVRPPVATPEP